MEIGPDLVSGLQFPVYWRDYGRLCDFYPTPELPSTVGDGEDRQVGRTTHSHVSCYPGRLVRHCVTGPLREGPSRVQVSVCVEVSTTTSQVESDPGTHVPVVRSCRIPTSPPEVSRDSSLQGSGGPVVESLVTVLVPVPTVTVLSHLKCRLSMGVCPYRTVLAVRCVDPPWVLGYEVTVPRVYKTGVRERRRVGVNRFLGTGPTLHSGCTRLCRPYMSR